MKCLNLDKIYSTQRPRVQSMLDSFEKDGVISKINKIYIFGSSVRDDWHPGSDLDIAVEFNCETLNENYEYTEPVDKVFHLINKSVKTRYDFLVLNFEDIYKSKNLMNNIINKVLIYEQTHLL